MSPGSGTDRGSALERGICCREAGQEIENIREKAETLDAAAVAISNRQDASLTPIHLF